MVWPIIRQEIQVLDTPCRAAYYGAMNGVEHPHSKANIRRHYLKQRRALARRDVEVYSRLAAQNLCAQSSFQQAHCIHVYATGKDNELDTRPLLEYALKVGKEISVPTLGSHL